MGSDAIANAPVSTFAKDSSKKKKGSKLAKLRQNKLDVRKEQWLSQVNKGFKVETNNCGGALPLSIPKGIEGRKTQGNVPMRARGDEHHEILATFDNEEVSWVSSSGGRKFGRNSLCKNFSGSRSSCSGSCSSSSSEGEREEGCLDDWEAVADALSKECNKQSSDTEPQTEPDPFVSDGDSNSVNNICNTSTLETEAAGVDNPYQGTSRAWSPDDAFRPRSLPSLSKQHKLILDSGPCISQGPDILSWQRVVSQQPSSCPICCEDLDVTDSSFLPCPCGFRLCLFCHKTILEVDGRCPGCRKHYESVCSGVGFEGQPETLQMLTYNK